MTQSPIEPPNNSNPRSEDSLDRSPSRPLKSDEMIAVFVAFLTLGSVLFWGLTRGGVDSLFDDTMASNSPAGAVDEAQSPLLFGESDNEEGDRPDATAGSLERELEREGAPEGRVTRPSARAELAERAALRRARAGIAEPRSTGNMWDDFRTGAAGTAAGAAGIAATSGEAEALPENTEKVGEETTPPVSASEAAIAPPKEPSDFADVPDNYWAKPYIDGLSSRGLISGFVGGDFRPDEQVTRAQIANIVSRTFNLTANKADLEFSDVTGDYWARESIGEAVKGGFMTGFPDKTFKPNDPVTRAQALTTLVTGLGIEPPNNVQPTIERYTDKNTIPSWATEKIAAATAGSLVVNYPKVDEIKASQPTTRAELSAMIYQALAEQGVVDPIESKYTVKP